MYGHWYNCHFNTPHFDYKCPLLFNVPIVVVYKQFLHKIGTFLYIVLPYLNLIFVMTLLHYKKNTFWCDSIHHVWSSCIFPIQTVLYKVYHTAYQLVDMAPTVLSPQTIDQTSNAFPTINVTVFLRPNHTDHKCHKGEWGLTISNV